MPATTDNAAAAAKRRPNGEADAVADADADADADAVAVPTANGDDAIERRDEAKTDVDGAPAGAAAERNARLRRAMSELSERRPECRARADARRVAHSIRFFCGV